MKPKVKSEHRCLYCDNAYRKQDFPVCPFCAGDGGNVTSKVWKPSKRQRREFAKKQPII